ncbi:extracellular matrix protein 1-like [Anoplopoma fimbria]|uniref:extracellular matrix protein 1-like n=1 Tax=Anoplopoma fimbria TaxID=229290 RepID=UPI0023EC5E33|nr:extracellular matrix protein 1-like [Anoplopoma fimbria]
MGSSGALVCCTAFVLILLSSASHDFPDEHIFEQREVTFDKIIQAMEDSDSFIFQKEVDLRDYVMKEGSKPGVLTPRGGRPRPRSFRGPYFLEYPVQFPVGRPTSDNLQAICLHGEHRPNYPASYFPVSSYGQHKRMGSAVNMAESWFSTCCKGNQTWEREVTLCCATQAWELSVQLFCEEASSIKAPLYHCCRLRGNDKLNCFQNDAPNPNYEATEELLVPPLPSTVNFSFDPSTCQRTEMIPQSLRGNGDAPRKVDISFPPGQPTADTIETLCRNQKQRPLYKINCLAGEEYAWLARQAKTINRIEKGFKQCCKKKHGVLNCADQKWREELNKYCVDENGEKVDFPCCLVGESNDRYSCFRNVSDDPHYDMTSATEELSLHKICDTHKIIKKKFPVGFPVKHLVDQCCPLPEELKTACFEQKLEELSQICSAKKTSPPAVRRCCRMSSQRPAQCMSKILMDAISKANNVSRQKKRKKCPLS